MGMRKDGEETKNRGFGEFISDLFTNRGMLRNARTVVVVVLVVIAPLLYFGYADSLTIERLLTFQFGGISVVVALSAYLTNKESRLRAFDNAYEIDEEKANSKDLKQLESDYEKNASDIRQKDPRMKTAVNAVNDYNKEQQEMYNRIKTDDQIAKLERKLVKARLDGKDGKAGRLEKHIERLKKEPLFDKSFEPYDVKEIVNANTDKSRLRRKKKGNAEIKVNPTKVNPFSQGASTLLRGMTGGIAGTLPFALSEEPMTVLRFYMVYAFILIFTVVTSYSLTIMRTLGSYKKSLDRKIAIQDLILTKIKEGVYGEPRTEIQQEASGGTADETDTQQDRGSEARDIEEDGGGEE